MEQKSKYKEYREAITDVTVTIGILTGLLSGVITHGEFYIIISIYRLIYK